MAKTRTPGITISSDARRFIDKRHRGAPIRVGAIAQKQVEERVLSNYWVDADHTASRQ